METIEKCPICDHDQFEPFLTCQDSMHSHEQFLLMKCKYCSFVLTNPRPDKESLANYYLSDKYISHTSKSKGFLDQIYLIARNFTLRWKVNIIKNFNKSRSLSIFDYGCGTGEFLKACKSQHWQISGFEPSSDAREKAEKLTGINIARDPNQLTNQKFDVITLWHVLEHVSDLEQTLALLTSTLQKGGYLLIAVPNHESPDAQFYKQQWAAYDVPRHLWHFTKSTMKRLLQKEGLRVKEIRPMKLDTFYVSLLSEKYLNNNQTSPRTFAKGIYHAFVSNIRANATHNQSSLIYIITK